MPSRTTIDRASIPWLLTAAIFPLAAVQMHLDGRLWWCTLGDWSPWSSDVWGPHNSQHFLDPYSLTHVTHGVLLCGLAWLLLPRAGLGWQLFIATVLEAAWEVVENTDFVIDRYREETAAIGYHGDTVVNSLGDIACCVAGFAIARRLGLMKSIVFVVGLELALLVSIRDNLLLNVVMLFWPLDAVKAWQTPS
ncbi:MAG TPA: DUF2585 family protein [Pirellulales bacterium]|nr:DUF2585 family protein [Pirellulales bacterium]